MNSILDDISKKLNCPNYLVRYRLMCQENADMIAKYINESEKLETTYSDRNGLKYTIRCDGITTSGAHLVKAFGDLSYPFNISVAAYFFAHHKIKLQYPFHQCVIVRTSTYNGICERYFPLELVCFAPTSPPSPSSTSSGITFKTRRTRATSFTSTTSLNSIPLSIEDLPPTSTNAKSRPGILWIEIEGNPNQWEKRNILIDSEI
uniref:Uncharacterized protein n=1 Tax=Meloidogyne enterolobii TaxID=390850 RepID=A0A6V7X1N3_MELEN|nr:unnamed protein product [Meloidogyne enterolobii]